MGDEGQVATRHDLLLVAADWQSRALILAELQELGYQVMAVPGVTYAVKAVLRGLVDPPLLLIDVHHDPAATPEQVQGLLALLPHRPVILMVGIFDRDRWEPLRGQVTRYFQRPVRIGDVIAAVQELISPEGTGE